ncbi:MAG TPA: hypothetical protein EYP46_00510, partial [Hadesarchaea archaeon]|nr:hypothetical protein [Hadesarchaea archaeon]
QSCQFDCFFHGEQLAAESKGILHTPNVLKKDRRKDVGGAIQRVPVDEKALDILPCGFSLRDFLNADLSVLSGIITELSPNYDYVLLDTASSLSKHSLVPPRFAEEALFVVSPEPASGPDSSRLKLALQVLHPKLAMSAVLNKFKKGKGRPTAADVQSRLGIETPLEIPEDDKMDESIRRRVPLVVYKPKSKAAKAIMELARLIVTKRALSLKEAEERKEKGPRIKSSRKDKLETENHQHPDRYSLTRCLRRGRVSGWFLGPGFNGCGGGGHRPREHRGHYDVGHEKREALRSIGEGNRTSQKGNLRVHLQKHRRSGP